MCVSPVTIPNPNYGCTSIGVNKYLHDTESATISVPCGHCPDCIALKQSYMVQRCRLLALDHDLYFATLTYCNEMLPICKVGDYYHSFPDFRDIQLLMKRLRNNDCFDGRDWKYLVCSEYGGLKHRPHFHVIFFVKRSPAMQKCFDNDLHLYRMYQTKFERDLFRNVLFYWSVNTGSKRVPVYSPLCRYRVSSDGSRSYDLHYVMPTDSEHGTDDVAFYVSKYCFKFDKWFQRKQQALKLNLDEYLYDFVYNLIKPRIVISKNFGNALEYAPLIRDGIDKSLSVKSTYPFFVNRSDGSTYPLAPYLRKKFMTLEDALKFYEFRNNPQYDSKIVLSPDYVKSPEIKYYRYNKVCDLITNRNSDNFYDDE